MSDEDLMAQTPSSTAVSGNIELTLGEIDNPDYVIVLNRSKERVTFNCRPFRVWLFLQEPPNEIYAPMHRGQSVFSRGYMSSPEIKGS